MYYLTFHVTNDLHNIFKKQEIKFLSEFDFLIKSVRIGKAEMKIGTAR